MTKDLEQFRKKAQAFLKEQGEAFDSPMEAIDYFTRNYYEETEGKQCSLQLETRKEVFAEIVSEGDHGSFLGIIDPKGEAPLGVFSHSLKDDPSNPLRGLRLDRVRRLYDAGLRTYGDFEALTENTLLKLNGIAPETIEELKANGVRFKK